LAQSEARFRNLTEISSDFYWETDAEHRYSSIEFGKAYVGIRDLGLKLGRTRWEIPSPRPTRGWGRAPRGVRRARRSWIFGFSPHGGGAERLRESAASPRFDARAGSWAIAAVGRDVHRAQRAELALRRSQHTSPNTEAESQRVAAYNETTVLYGRRRFTASGVLTRRRVCRAAPQRQLRGACARYVAADAAIGPGTAGVEAGSPLIS